MKVIISGGGTGGHIFPAISIANAIKEQEPFAEILFVGALGKMEMEKVPDAGYRIVGLPVAGFQRRLTLKNLSFFLKLYSSLKKAKSIIREFVPDVVIGVGGYASGPVLRVASRWGIPTLIQEQNSYPGVTNRILSKKVDKICVAYSGMEKYFPESKIILSGNPVRQNLISGYNKIDALNHFGLQSDKKIVLVIGGSLGARSVNQGIQKGLSKFFEHDIQVIWQTGKFYYEEMKKSVPNQYDTNIKVLDFIQKMSYAYGLADVIISRAGASSISEIALLGKPAVFVPSPNVAEDHQTKNAMALVNESAAVMVADKDTDQLSDVVIELLDNPEKMETMKQSLSKFAKPYAAKEIADEIFKLVKHS